MACGHSTQAEANLFSRTREVKARPIRWRISSDQGSNINHEPMLRYKSTIVSSAWRCWGARISPPSPPVVGSLIQCVFLVSLMPLIYRYCALSLCTGRVILGGSSQLQRSHHCSLILYRFSFSPYTSADRSCLVPFSATGFCGDFKLSDDSDTK